MSFYACELITKSVYGRYTYRKWPQASPACFASAPCPRYTTRQLNLNGISAPTLVQMQEGAELVTKKKVHVYFLKS